MDPKVSLEHTEGEAEIKEQSPAPSNDGDWRSKLPEDLRSHGDIKAAESIEDLAKRYAGARAKMSRMINIPSHEAGEEEKAEFFEKLQAVDGVARIPNLDDKDGWKSLYQRLGVPDAPDKYKFDKDDPDLAKQLHSLSLNGGQAEAVARMVHNAAQTTKEAAEAEAKAGMDELQQEWGDDFQRRLKAASMALKEFGGEEIFKFYDDMGLSGRAEIAKMGYNLSQKLAAGKMPMGDLTARYGMSRDEAQDALNSIMRNPEDPYFKPDHPDHENRVLTALRYHEMLHPKEEQPLSRIVSA